ncbi:MAG: putative Ig domain-containing protein [Planctomycetota bacterium]|jgi:hypothetical protein
MRSIGLIVIALAVILAATCAAEATTYEIGPGKTYTNVIDMPWESLVAGDTVLIYYRATPYKEKIGIFSQGTEANPITVSGVAGGGGELPILDGIDAVSREQQSYWSDERCVIKLGGTNIPPEDPTPTWIIFEDLDIKSARPPYTYTCDEGTSKSYLQSASSIYVEKGKNITVRNCILRDCGNGFFTASSDAEATESILIQGCHIWDNGIDGSIYHHNNYTASLFITHEYNHMGPLRSGCSGNNLKDRSAGQIVRYNYIEGGNRQLDLINAEDSILIADDPSHDETHVYGNILIEYDADGNRQMVHYGKDTSGGTRDGTLWFYNNTMYSERSDRNSFFRMSGGSTCVLDLRNNIIYPTLYTASYNELTSADSRKGTINLRNCWLKVDWVLGGRMTLNNYGGNVEEMDPLLEDPANRDFKLTSSSNCIDAGTTLDSSCLPDHNVTKQYVYLADWETRPVDSTFDIGAYEYPGGPPPDLEITTTSLPNGQVNVAYSETLQATGGVTPYTWSVISGSLPAGLSLTASTGEISGTPTTEETANFTVQVTDSQDPADTDTQALSITIDPEPSGPTITTTSLPDGTRKVDYSAYVEATGGTPPYTWSIVSGSLPTGLGLNSSTGEISGNPKKAETKNFTVRCTDDASQWDEQALSITINPS